MKNTLLLLKGLLLACLFYVLLFSVKGYCQQPDFDWKWAMNGGGSKRVNNEDTSSYINNKIGYQRVMDVVVDADNNAYVLALIGQDNTVFNGDPVAVYEDPYYNASLTDLFLTSLDCEGTVRWTRVVGGGDLDQAYNLGLDKQGGLYLGALVLNRYSRNKDFGLNNRFSYPPYFDDTTHLPYLNGAPDSIPHEGFKSMALAKYHTLDGSLEWVRFPEGKVALKAEEKGYKEAWMSNLTHMANKVVTEADGTTHWLVALRPGTHLNGALQIAGGHSFPGYHEFHVVVYAADGSLKRHFKVPLSTNAEYDKTIFGGGGMLVRTDQHNFWYDAGTQQYYLGGRWDGNEVPRPSFAGTPFVNNGYVVAFNSSGKELWRVVDNATPKAFSIVDLKTDSAGDVYITGAASTSSSKDSEKEHFIGNYRTPKTEPDGPSPYVMKLSGKTGSVLWGNFATILHIGFAGNKGTSLSFSKEEVVVGIGMSFYDWGPFESHTPDTGTINPFLARFSQKTGEITGLHRIDGGRYYSSLTAVAVDRDGNFITGGFQLGDLFHRHPTIPMLYRATVGGSTDFFVAKLAASDCGTPVLAAASFSDNKPVFYPNPTSDVVYWEAGGTWQVYQVYDLMGRSVANGVVEGDSLSLGNLPSGTYMLSLLDFKGHKVTGKIVVK